MILRRVTTLLVAGALALGLAACQQKPVADDATKTADANTTAEQPATAAQPASTPSQQ